MLSTFLRRVAPAVAAVAAATVVALGAGFMTPAGGAPSDEPRLLAVRLEQAPTDDGSDDGPLGPARSAGQTRYAEFQVDHGGVTRRLQPVAASVTATPIAAASATSVEIDGLRTGSAAEGFESTLAEALGSASLDSFLRIDTGGTTGPAVVEITLGRQLQGGDYLLVQEAGGDATFDIEAVGADGATIGAPRSVGPPYRWDSGQRSGDGEAQLVSVIDVSPWVAWGDVTGLRLLADTAEVKVLVLEPTAGVIPLPVTEAVTASSTPATPTRPAPVSTTSPPPPAPTVTMPATPSSTAPTTPTTAPPAQPIETSSNPATRVLAQADGPAPTALAMTGVSTDPWVLVALATGLIFFGYTTVAAFRRPAHRAAPGEPAGHAQLDALGFD